MRLTNQPLKGTQDWFPQEFAVRKYIFDTWRRVCEQFGYQEYLTPLVEYADLYRAKSGEDVGGEELTVFTDRGGRALAIRPEMTPSVTRMVSRRYASLPKPIRLFSIANFFRNEKPQRGRNREFWQLNYDIFGSDSINADLEVVQVALEIMLSFNPPDGSFVVWINNRKLIDKVISNLGNVREEVSLEVMRALDKWGKIGEAQTRERLARIGLGTKQIDLLVEFMQCEKEEEVRARLPGLKIDTVLAEIKTIIVTLKKLGYGAWVQFKPNLVRGFDYYDGMVFEVFDNNPDNRRSLFGGGRYNALAGLFGVESFPAVGCAPGDETTRLFLESWNLIEKLEVGGTTSQIFIPLLDESLVSQVMILARELRARGEIVAVGLREQKLGSALDYANKRGFDKVVFLGNDEIAKGVYVMRDMASGEQQEFKFRL